MLFRKQCIKDHGIMTLFIMNDPLNMISKRKDVRIL